MKKEDILICLHNKFSNGLTRGKEYPIVGFVENDDDNKVRVVDDKGQTRTFYKSRFKVKTSIKEVETV